MNTIVQETNYDETDVQLEQVIEDVERLGYGEFLTAYAPHLIGTHHWQNGRSLAPPKLQTIIDLLLLGRKIPTALAAERLPSFNALVANGIAVVKGDHIQVPNLALVCIASLWLFVQRPQRNPTIYIGHDTYGLMARIRVKRGARALDLCSGPGSQGLYMASRGAQVTAVECNVVAAEVARLNAVTNDLDSSFKVKVGDLYEALGDNPPQFDVITANPPLLPFPDEHFYPFVGHGGEDGLSVTWRIIAGFPKLLAPEGHAQIIGTCFSDGYLPTSLEDFKKIAAQLNLDMLITIVGHADFARGSPTFEGLAYTAAMGEHATKLPEIREGLERIALRVEATHLCYFCLYVRHGSGEVNVMDLNDETRQALWFCN